VESAVDENVVGRWPRSRRCRIATAVTGPYREIAPGLKKSRREDCIGHSLGSLFTGAPQPLVERNEFGAASTAGHDAFHDYATEYVVRKGYRFTWGWPDSPGRFAQRRAAAGCCDRSQGRRESASGAVGSRLSVPKSGELKAARSHS